MAVLASLNDVKRVLHRDTSDTADESGLAAALDVATEHVTSYLREDWTLAGGSVQTAKYWDQPEQAYIPIPLQGAVIQQIRFYRTPTATSYVAIPGTDYDIMDDRRIRFHPTMFDIPFEGAMSLHVPDNWSRIEVDFTPPAAVPTRVRDAVALTAAAIFTRGPISVGGFASENLGDYGYSVRAARGAQGDSAAIPDVAKDLLRPLRRRTSLVV